MEEQAKDLFKLYGCGAFVTFTYDDSTLPFNEGNPHPTLRYADFQKFLKRLRRQIDYHKLNTPYCNPKFKYIAVGEYGDEFHRPHYHVLFFGLDYQVCKKMFFKSWQLGLIQSAPIKKGGIRYVLKYLDKQSVNDKGENIYELRGVEQPFHRHSLNLSQNYLLTNYEKLVKNNGEYQGFHKSIKVLPKYYKDKLRLGSNHDYNGIRYQMLTKGLYPKNGDRFTLQEIQDYQVSNGWKDIQDSIRASRSDGQAVNDINTYYTSEFNTRDLLKEIFNEDIYNL